ncbi:acyltransferase family protein [Granulicella sp. 5B5]|uniref:acyltransferase family protein n=1 Tax=Granulicella sp. 5B5 TaxID=1617967 RepID=UPI0015F44C2B|nr:acyltransferase [Granulicella sp. 5B5]QMV17887.1 acyltransferase family protein [Granulicella sp. 5B5]
MEATSVALPPKRHYPILDGLRGVAAIIVVTFHTLEVYSHGDHAKQILNHGYLAVDFFFLLSGFVVAYAYDDRWSRMTLAGFAKRRLIRLQPMVVMGSIIGAIFFYFQSGPTFPLVAGTPVWKLLLVMLIGCTLIPLPVSMDIRGWQEMHPLDGPAWSLFFEYVANILYALVLRKISNRWLSLLVLLAAGFLLQLALTAPSGDVIGGWSITATQLHIGFARLLYPFLAGVLLMRLDWRINVRSGFAVCSVLLALALCLPRAGSPQHVWENGLYDALCILIVFPLIVAAGAGSAESGGWLQRLSKFLGDLSYPLYITHYPLIYMQTAWVIQKHPTFEQSVVVDVLLIVVAISIAYASLKLYDEPVRRWLSAKFA